MKKYILLYGGIIALSFLWTGSAYISVAYRLMESYTPLQIDIYHVIIGYLLQVCGMLLFSLGLRLYPRIFSKKLLFVVAMLAEAVVITTAILSASDAVSFTFGFVMNFLHGIIAGIYLTQLCCFVPQQYRGRIFGLGYAVGSIGSWLISLPFGGMFLRMDAVIIVYMALIALTILLASKASTDYVVTGGVAVKGALEPKFLISVFIGLFLLSMVKNIGFYFPASDISGMINLEFSRSFYAVGLIAAGIINDKDRRYGAICCMASLVFAFFSFALSGNPEYSLIIWIFGYVFFGFFSVYRVVVFSDMASRSASLVHLAAYGLMAGRIGDSLGTLGGILLSGNVVPLLLVTSVLFIFVVFMFFPLYNKLYGPVTDNERKEQRLEAFEKKHVLSKREKDVFRLVVQGFSNSEISGALFISESTVKYHVGNIFKKTDCSNRTDLTMMFKNS